MLQSHELQELVNNESFSELGKGTYNLAYCSDRVFTVNGHAGLWVLKIPLVMCYVSLTIPERMFAVARFGHLGRQVFFRIPGKLYFFDSQGQLLLVSCDFAKLKDFDDLFSKSNLINGKSKQLNMFELRMIQRIMSNFTFSDDLFFQDDLNYKARAVRKWNKLNPTLAPAYELEHGWLSPYVKAKNHKLSDEQTAEAVLNFYRRTNNLILDIATPGNLFLTEDDELICVDVDLALEKGSEVSDVYYQYDAYSQTTNRYLQSYDESFNFHLTIQAIRTILHLQKYLTTEDIQNQQLTLKKIGELAVFFDMRIPVTSNQLQLFNEILLIEAQFSPGYSLTWVRDLAANINRCKYANHITYVLLERSDYAEQYLDNLIAVEDPQILKDLLNAQTKTGLTSLMCAISYTELPIVKKLITAGASLDVRCNEGNTALFCAIIANKLDMVEYLLNLGAVMTGFNNSNINILQLAYSHSEESFHILILRLIELSLEEQSVFFQAIDLPHYRNILQYVAVIDDVFFDDLIQYNEVPIFLHAELDNLNLRLQILFDLDLKAYIQLLITEKNRTHGHHQACLESFLTALIAEKNLFVSDSEILSTSVQKFKDNCLEILKKANGCLMTKYYQPPLYTLFIGSTEEVHDKFRILYKKINELSYTDAHTLNLIT